NLQEKEEVTDKSAVGRPAYTLHVSREECKGYARQKNNPAFDAGMCFYDIIYSFGGADNG
ncbi:MAG: hypothetical protein IKF42_01570, partial [Mogibacterium sp.]|nr:hypothetical protein [Mogibacterium sp.]